MQHDTFVCFTPYVVYYPLTTRANRPPIYLPDSDDVLCGVHDTERERDTKFGSGFESSGRSMQDDYLVFGRFKILFT